MRGVTQVSCIADSIDKTHKSIPSHHISFTLALNSYADSSIWPGQISHDAFSKLTKLRTTIQTIMYNAALTIVGQSTIATMASNFTPPIMPILAVIDETVANTYELLLVHVTIYNDSVHIVNILPQPRSKQIKYFELCAIILPLTSEFKVTKTSSGWTVSNTAGTIAECTLKDTHVHANIVTQPPTNKHVKLVMTQIPMIMAYSNHDLSISPPTNISTKWLKTTKYIKTDNKYRYKL